MKRCSTSFVIREMQMKTIMRYVYSTYQDGQSPGHRLHTNCWLGGRATGTLLRSWWECKMRQPLWKAVCQFLTKLRLIDFTIVDVA